MACLSNQRQIGIAIAAYKADFNGYVPPAHTDRGFSGVQAQKHKWGYTIWEYAGYAKTSFAIHDNDLSQNFQTGGDNNVFHCPETLAQAYGTPMPPLVTSKVNALFSYALNISPHQRDASDPDRGNRGKKRQLATPESMIHSPAATFLVGEASGAETSSTLYHWSEGLLPHSGASNFLYFDMHAQAWAYDDLPPAQLPWKDDTPLWVGW
jgi:prepilin-type processing-associated H-X9-DG protein